MKEYVNWGRKDIINVKGLYVYILAHYSSCSFEKAAADMAEFLSVVLTIKDTLCFSSFHYNTVHSKTIFS